MAEIKTEKDPLDEFVEKFMSEMDLKGKDNIIKIKKFAKDHGLDYEKVKEAYISDKKKEDFANKIMEEEGMKGKSNRLKIMKIMDKVGWEKNKIKTALLRSTISERIEHH